MLPLVSAQRREQAMRYKHTFGRFCCLKSWLMLKEGIEDLGLTIEDFRYNEHGKPYLEHGPHFSISHCKEGIAVAISEDPIGIDIEAIRAADLSLIERVMNDEERQELIANSPQLRDRAFTRLWTQKEAVVKMLGTGIASFEQLQKILEIGEWKLKIVEKEKYIYSIAYE